MGWSNDQATTTVGLNQTYINSTAAFTSGSSLVVDNTSTFSAPPYLTARYYSDNASNVTKFSSSLTGFAVIAGVDKIYTNSRMRFQLHTSMFATAGPVTVQFGCQFNGPVVTDYLMGTMTLKGDDGFVHIPFSGVRYCENLPIGTYNAVARWKITAGDSVRQSATDDWVSFDVQEVAPSS